MQKQAPSTRAIAVMVIFAFSVFGLLLYIWKTFGGISPLAPNQYLVRADFDEANQLADTADVRISGVTVGRVVKTAESGRHTNVTMRIYPRYAPIPRDTQAILRQKTLVGETYVELTPGNRASGPLRDGATLARSQVKSTVELDEVLRALDPRTRRDAQRFLTSLATALQGRGQSLNDALGNLEPFTNHSAQLLGVLDTERSAVRRLVQDSGTVFASLAARQGDLSGLVRAGDQVLTTTARRNRDLADAVRILPTTLQQLRPTLADVRALSQEAAPVVRTLRPAAKVLGQSLTDAAEIAPVLRATFGDVDRAVTASKEGLPAAVDVLNAAHPLVRLLPPTLKQAHPAVQYLDLYKQELISQAALLGDSLDAATPAVGGGPPLHYLRALVPFTSEALVAYDKREGTNRHNPYLLPRGLDKLIQGLDSFDCSNTGNPSAGDPAPPCTVQKPLTFQGRSTAYPHVEPDK
jgi:phospholipid/cholesterol/gamma-HCH transport system substrate-binding protein